MPSTPVRSLIAVLILLVTVTAPVVGVPRIAPPDAEGDALTAETAAEASTCVTTGGATPAPTTESGTLSVETFVAPSEDYDRLTNASALASPNRGGRLTPASVGVDRTWEDEVAAYSDTIVHRIALNGSATRLLGRLAQQDRGSPTANFRTLVASGGVEFEYVGPTACPPTLALNASIDRGAIRVVPDSANDTLSLVLDTDRLLFYPPGDGEPTTDTFVKGHHGFSLTLRKSSGLVSRNTTVGNDYTVEDARVAFPADHNGLVRVSIGSNQSIRGETTLAPGNEVTVVLHPYTANTSAIETTAVVNRSRGFVARVDLSNASLGGTYVVSVPELTDSAKVEGGSVLVTVGNATTALLTVVNQTSTGTILYGTSLTTTDGGFVTVRNDSGGLVGVSEYVEPGTAVAQPKLSPALAESGTVTVTVYRDANGNGEFDDADVPYRANGNVVRDTAVVRLEDDEETTTTEVGTTPETDERNVEQSPSETTRQGTRGIPGFGVGPAVVALSAAIVVRVASR